MRNPCPNTLLSSRKKARKKKKKKKKTHLSLFSDAVSVSPAGSELGSCTLDSKRSPACGLGAPSERREDVHVPVAWKPLVKRFLLIQ
jgi:hypothetical protein